MSFDISQLYPHEMAAAREAVIAGGWLLFNAGFFAGAAWKGMFSEPKQSARPGYIELTGDEYHAVRCTMRSPEDVARRAGAL